MTSKERVFATFNFEPTDRVPFVLLDGSSWMIQQDNMSFAEQYELPDVGAAQLVRLSEMINSDTINSANSAAGAWMTAFGADITLNGVGLPHKTSPFVKDPFTDLPEDISYDAIRATLSENKFIKLMIKQNEEVKKLIGDEKPICAGITAPFTSAAISTGAAPFMKFLRKKPEAVARLVDFASTVCAVLNDLYAESGADIIATADPVGSGDMISLKMYQDLAVPAYKQFLEKRKHDLPIIMHICGNAGERLEDCMALGCKAFSIDSMVDVEDLLKRADHKICVMGNLSPAEQLMLGTPESVYAESTRLLDLAKANNGGFIISGGCDIGSKAVVENVLTITKATKDHAAG